MPWNPNTLIEAATAAGIRYKVDDTWLDISPYPKGSGTFDPVGVIWHHTACNPLAKGDMPSLPYCRTGPASYNGRSRVCHIVVGRSGDFQIIAGEGAWHAGAGGPLTVNGTPIPLNRANPRLIGIEIEASSTDKVNATDYQTPKIGMNPAQFDSVARFCAALFDILGWPTEAAIRHQDWAPKRKTDVNIPLRDIRAHIDYYRRAVVTPVPTPPAKPEPTPTPEPLSVSLKAVQPGKKNRDVLIVQKALKKEVGLDYSSGPGIFGPKTTAAYKKWQKKCGFSGDLVDGSPGRATLNRLGKIHGFKVKA